MEKKTKQFSIPETLVTSKIYIIRNKKIMLDRHLAELYEVETRALNQAVNRNHIIKYKEFLKREAINWLFIPKVNFYLLFRKLQPQ